MTSLIQKARFAVYRFKYRYARSLPLRAPVDVTLELASDCNMKCRYCYHADQERLPFTKGVMAFNVAAKIVHQAANLGVPAMKFNWKGEATINPHFGEITGLAKRLSGGGVLIDRLTNSNFKFRTDREDVFLGLCNQTKVKVSYDSFRKEVFERQRAGGDHAMTTRNIDKFYAHPKRRTTELVIQAVRTQLNKDEDLEAEVKRRWPEATISIRDMVAGRVENADVGVLEARSRDTTGRQACIQASARVIFNWEGKAFPCCPDIGEKLVLGDIRVTPLKDIFNGHPARNLRADLASGEAFRKGDPCRGCSSFETFKGFRPAWVS